MRSVSIALAFCFMSFSIMASAEQAPPYRAILYIEDPAKPKGSRAAGTVRWTTSAEGDTATAHVDIPEAMSTKLTFTRNDDPELPASHLIDIKFSPCRNAIARVSGIVLKENEIGHGKPLTGRAARPGCDRFLIALDRESSRENLARLRRDWIDIPFVLSDGRRAVLALKKGAAGAAAMRTAFSHARANPRPPCSFGPKPALDMTRAEANESCWGKPTRYRRSTTSDGISETAIYANGNILKFKDDRVVEIIEITER